VERVIAILKLASFDPEFVNEAARSFSVLGKGKEKESHLTAKVPFLRLLMGLDQADMDCSSYTHRSCGITYYLD